jgi:DNA-binding transcriptional regulator YiaG
MARITVQQRTLKRAREILGGSDQQLARVLLVPLASLNLWLEGKERPPAWVFLRAADIVNEGEDSIYAQMLREQLPANDTKAA